MHQARDYGINHIQARKDHKCYGMGLGVMILDEVYPGFPGDVRNASAFPFPVQYEIIRDVDMPKLIYAQNKSACLESIQRAAQNLEQMGCRAIAAECGFFAYFQREIAASVNVPVFLSSLLQVTIAQQVVGPHKVIGIIGHAESGQYTEHLLASV
ncbi:MAG: hypothetical protein PVG84_20970, partial [Desulfobacterales bacterium]